LGKGFEILAFPFNQFAGQEPGSNKEIKEVACTMFKAESPIFWTGYTGQEGGQEIVDVVFGCYNAGLNSHVIIIFFSAIILF